MEKEDLDSYNKLLEDCRLLKTQDISEQKWEEAAKYRDKERFYLKKIEKLNSPELENEI